MKPLDETYEPVVIEDDDDIGSNRSANRPLLELAKTRMSRRTALKGFVTTAAVGALGHTLTSRFALAAEGGPSTLGFQSLEQVITENHAGRARLQRQRPDPLGRPGLTEPRLRSDEPDGRRPG